MSGVESEAAKALKAAYDKCEESRDRYIELSRGFEKEMGNIEMVAVQIFGCACKLHDLTCDKCS